MADETVAKSTAAKKPAAAKPPAEKKDEGHAWVVLDADGVVHMVERSQLRAALVAISVKGSLLRWPFGGTRDAATEAKP